MHLKGVSASENVSCAKTVMQGALLFRVLNARQHRWLTGAFVHSPHALEQQCFGTLTNDLLGLRLRRIE